MNPTTNTKAGAVADVAAKPVRVQLRRTKGWRMPANTVSVARPGKWGNPFRILNEEGFPLIQGADGLCYEAPGYTEWSWGNVAQQAVDLFRLRAVDALPNLAPLRGKNLACWCKPGTPCHADVLLELANASVRQHLEQGARAS